MAVDILLGLQWGDEGKGKIVDFLAPQYDLIARFQGGPNAGHTIKVNGSSIVLHTVPSGIFHKNAMNLIGNGVVVDPVSLETELQEIRSLGGTPENNLFISAKAHLILPSHKILDAALENSKGNKKIGSTLKGIGPTYTDKTARNGLRVGDIVHPNFREQYEERKKEHLYWINALNFEHDVAALEEDWFSAIEKLKEIPQVKAEYYVNDYLKAGKNILAEGAQGSMLDLDHGTYPFVTSSNTISAAACVGLGFSPDKIRDVYGISKAYCTRVGSGPFPTQLDDEIGARLRDNGNEYGATTGRPRRCGWLDLVALNYSIMINGVTRLILTKMDVLNDFENIQVCDEYTLNDGTRTKELPHRLDTEYAKPSFKGFAGWNAGLSDVSSFEELPAEAAAFVDEISRECGVHIHMLSTGPGREELVLRKVLA